MEDFGIEEFSTDCIDLQKSIRIEKELYELIPEVEQARLQSKIHEFRNQSSSDKIFKMTNQQKEGNQTKTYFKKQEFMDRALGSQTNIENTVSYFGILKHLFPEITGLPSLNINIMDAIFYNCDGSMCYICTDGDRGLIKTKCKNYSETLMKRKSQFDSGSSFLGSIESDSYHKHLNYVALLRYKDHSFLRLKESEFKSIFLRPVQANEKYRFVGNTQYIQILPLEANIKQGSLHQIEFDLETYKEKKLFKLVQEKHLQETSFTETGTCMEIKRELKAKSIKGYLLFVIFEVFAYISVHYHKHLSEGLFEFMEVRGEFYLSNIRKAKLVQSPIIESEYSKSNILSAFLDFEKDACLEPEISSKVMSTIEGFFQKENKKIFEGVRNFIKNKFDEVEDKEDREKSSQIFDQINQNFGQDQPFHEILNNQNLYTRFLLKKKEQVDGTSPITSISNIARKNYAKKNNNFMKQCQKTKISATQSTKFKRFHLSQGIKKEQNSKWIKREFNSRKKHY